jgi:Tfp pilus assembly protein PilN
MIHAPGINLARRPFRNNTMLYCVFIGCALLLLAGSLYNYWEFRRTGVELEALQSEIGIIDQRQQELAAQVEQVRQEIRAVDLTTFNAKADFANGLLLSKFFSWSDLFDLLEDLMPPEVKLRSIRPSVSAQRIEVQVDGLAQSPMALYEFQKALDEDEHFANVYPLSENTRETRGELNFDLVMDYVPGGKEEDVTEASQPVQADGKPGASGAPVVPAASGAAPAAAADPNAASEEDDDWDDWDEEETGVPAEAAPQKKPADPNGGGR